MSPLLLALAATLLAHPPASRDAALDSLAEATARLTTRFADRRVAIAEGYRRVGADFPGMGEHWVHPPTLLTGRIDPSRPTILAYATIAGRATLVGAGYIVTTGGGSPSRAVPGWPHAWHEHSGFLADESGARAGHARESSDTRVWVLHVWTGLANPAGRFAPDNWALPFSRAELAAPMHVDHDAGRAASLAVGDGDAFLRGTLDDAGLRSPGNASAVDAAIAHARAAADAVLLGARARGAVSAEDASALRSAWRTLATALREVLGPAVEPLLVPAHP